jgi:hypothetical protein
MIFFLHISVSAHLYVAATTAILIPTVASLTLVLEILHYILNLHCCLNQVM